MHASDNAIVQVRQIDGQSIYIIDGLFKMDLVRAVHAICRRLPFLRNEYSNDPGEKERDLNHNFDMDYLTQNPIFSWWKGQIIDRVNSLYIDNSFKLSRIYCNSQSYGDFQIIHTDILLGLTALYIVNEEWVEEWHGETVFYDRNREPICLVAPRPGRLVIFPGDMLHRGGSPSRKCYEPRLSIAFKFKLRTA